MKTDIRAVLAEADQDFSATGDGLSALGWVALAAKTGQPIPPAIGKWLHAAINSYRSNPQVTFEAALGLDAPGAANPRGKLRRKSAVEGDLGRMMVLHAIGATIEQAAAMVERVSLAGVNQETLMRRFKGKLAAMAKRDRPMALQRFHWSEIEAMLAEYPEHGRPEIEQAKAGIRAAYGKPGF